MSDFLDDLKGNNGEAEVPSDWIDGETMTRKSKAQPARGDDGQTHPTSSRVLDHEKITEEKRQRAIVEACVNDRIFFAVVVLGIELEQWQLDVLSALDRGETRISIRSGNGAGKTCLVAVIVLHYILFRNDVKIPVTAPASSQLKDGLIPECAKWMRVLPDFLKNQLDMTQDRIVRVDSPNNNFISFRTARKETPEALAGIHATFVMCCVDEASAVVEQVYEAAKGTLSTPGAIFLMISNPTRLSGTFFDSHNRLKSRWCLFHVSSFDTSRVDQDFVDDIVDTYGINSNQYQVKVLGNFPKSEDETLIDRSIAESAIGRDVQAITDIPIWGVDVGRGGDLSAMVQRKGNVIDRIETKNFTDTMQTVGWINEMYQTAVIKPEAIYVDSIGIGAGVADRLRELGLPSIDVNVSESTAMKDRYVRLRDELWYSLKDWLTTMAVAVDVEQQKMRDMFVDEVSAPLALFTSTGKNGVESKSQLRARFIKSPNVADAACLTFAYQGAVGAGAYGGANNKAWGTVVDFSPSSVF
jgi:phage terminase large subunit